MEIFDSSPYVKERAKKIASYLMKRGWFVTAGKNNAILINIGEEARFYDADRLAEIIVEADKHVQETGLPVNDVSYEFYYKGNLYTSFTIYDVRQFDGRED